MTTSWWSPSPGSRSSPRPAAAPSERRSRSPIRRRSSSSGWGTSTNEQRYTGTNASRTEGQPNSIAFGDLDGDGKLDVALAGGGTLTSGGSVVFYGTAADLQVTVTANPDPVLAGGAVGYQVTVTNAGPDATEPTPASEPAVVKSPPPGSRADRAR